MQVYIGIDWAQNKHDLCYLNQAGARLTQMTSQYRFRQGIFPPSGGEPYTPFVGCIPGVLVVR